MTEFERLARAAIEKTLAACTQAGDARKADAYAECFTSEGVLDLGDPRLEGRDAIRRFMQAPSPIPQPRGRAPGFVSHHLTTCRIELTSPGSATVRTYWLVTTVIGIDHNGYYDDIFSQVGDAWLIASRRPRTLWKHPDSLVG
jgi:hypothetical protein